MLRLLTAPRLPVVARAAASRRAPAGLTATLLAARLTATLLAAGLAVTTLLTGCATRPGAGAAQGAPPYALTGVENLTRVAQLTGKDSINRTDRFLVSGADLGSMFRFRDRTYFVFGDTFGPRSARQFGGGGENWRSNTMAYSTQLDPAGGIRFDGWITDSSGAAKELIHSEKRNGSEITVIPTYGVAAGGSMYLFYMSVKVWGAPGHWTCNYAGIARSTDGGATWTKLASPRWPGDSNFVQAAIYNQGGELYIWTIPAGRFGGVHLMRVAEKDIERASRYEYFAGTSNGRPRWSRKMEEAVQIVEPPVGELSVVPNRYLDAWIMTYLNEETHNLEIREGRTPWGPWGAAKTLVSAAEYPGLYGAFMLPQYTQDGDRQIYFTMSQWGPYNVFWMRADLVRAPN